MKMKLNRVFISEPYNHTPIDRCINNLSLVGFCTLSELDVMVHEINNLRNV